VQDLVPLREGLALQAVALAKAWGGLFEGTESWGEGVIGKSDLFYHGVTRGFTEKSTEFKSPRRFVAPGRTWNLEPTFATSLLLWSLVFGLWSLVFYLLSFIF